MLKRLFPIVAVYLCCVFAALPALASLPGSVCPSLHAMARHKECRMMGPACPMKKHAKGMTRACPLKPEVSPGAYALACDCGGGAPHAATAGSSHEALPASSPRFAIQVFEGYHLLPPKESSPSGYPDGPEHPPRNYSL